MPKACGCLVRVVVALGLGIGLLAVLMPTAGRSLLRRFLVQNLNFSGLRVQDLEIRSLRFNGIEIERLRMRGENALSALSIERLLVQYHLGRLLRGRIDRIAISDVVIEVTVDSKDFPDGAIHLPAGINAAQISGTNNTRAARLPPKTIPRIQQISLDGGRIICRREQDSWTMPWAATLHLESPPSQYSFRIQAGAPPSMIQATGLVEAIAGQGHVSLTANEFPLALLAQMAGRPDPLPFPVRTTAEISARFVKWLPIDGQYITSWELPPPPGRVEWNGHWGKTADGQWSCTGELPQILLLQGRDLGDWNPKLAGVELWGGISATASVLLDGQSTQTHAIVTMDNLNAGLKGQSTSLSNLSGTIEFSSVLDRITDGVQTVRFERIQSGPVAITAGTVAFAMQGPDKIQLDQASGNFCGGSLEIGGIDFRADGQPMACTLKCEGVQLAQLLNLTEWVVAEGTAEMSGQLPFRIHGRQIEVENGFLETAAGQSCRFRIQQDHLLTRNLPAGNSSYLYASIAEEALKDFRCDWARADIRLAQDKVTVALSVRGAPNQRLPFSYDLKKKTFFRTTPEKSNANFSNGITLTLRFNDVSVEDLLASAPALDMLMNGN